ncbi:hypothetical protein [Persicirhabdus sediminis]|uniref:Uncharacterized protein n=1 Tax=Persicirhabdus sediminis TaxID=454144 RepID=A0A8J7SM25_9BACT|nr:hypothetical protein [Persicirhabdus sediminis]MBK1791785.1 hypothetical protein [Persicirhabdus sediminis]
MAFAQSKRLAGSYKENYAGKGARSALQVEGTHCVLQVEGSHCVLQVEGVRFALKVVSCHL